MARKSLLDAAADAIARNIQDVATNPRKLKPGELCRILNSTPLGPVITDRKLRGHRTRAGLRIGDGKTADLFRYAAWLFGEAQRPSDTTNEPTGATATSIAADFDAYEAKKERERERNASASRKGRDLGELPPVADPKRRAAALKSLRKFCESYFGERFALGWSPSHLTLIERLKATVEGGGLQAFAMPRGSGKTTIAEVAVLWAVMTGRRKFVALIGASREHADEMLDSVKAELETNDELAADFPEVCIPIRALEGINNRCKGQLHKGKRTMIRWAGATIVLPTIEGSQASSAIICVRGITGRVRGMKFQRPDGGSVRPDLCIIDDPQTDSSAGSDTQCTKRLRVITGAILGLAGPGRKIAAMCPCTVIRRGDLADQLLDREKHPEWHGELTQMLVSWPANLELWERYGDIRREDLRSGGTGVAGTEFYRQNRKTMDVGGKVYWEDRKNEDELSALQHAMNLWIDNPEAFAAEYQNAPLAEDHEANQLVTVDDVQRKTNGIKRGIVPLDATTLTAFIDVQHTVLYWALVGWSPDFSGGVVNYGTFPDQKRSYFTLRQARRTLQQLTKGTSTDAAVLAGLEQLTDLLLGQEWKREDGSSAQVDLCLIDCQDGTLANTLHMFCRTSKHAARLRASNGKGIGPSDRQMRDWQTRPGEQKGDHWIQRRSTKHAVRTVLIDTNFWKTFLHQRLSAAAGDKGSLSLFGGRSTDHRMIAEHVTSEYSQRLTHDKSGVSCDVWRLKPGQSENHWFDCLVGSAVAASIQGCSLLKPQTAASVKRRSKNRVTYL